MSNLPDERPDHVTDINKMIEGTTTNLPANHPDHVADLDKMIETFASPFDRIRRFRPDGSAYWSCREMQPFMGYTEWRNLKTAINLAMEDCRNQGYDPVDHFVESCKMIEVGKGAMREIKDVELTLYGCSLLAINGDPRKPETSAAKGYFIVKAREAEVGSSPAVADKIEALARKIEELQRQLIRARRELGEAKASPLMLTSQEVAARSMELNPSEDWRDARAISRWLVAEHRDTFTEADVREFFPRRFFRDDVRLLAALRYLVDRGAIRARRPVRMAGAEPPPVRPTIYQVMF